MEIEYHIEEDSQNIVFEDAHLFRNASRREINTILLEMDKATLATQIVRDNDAALTSDTLSIFSVAQIKDFLELAIASNATRCTALLLEYKNKHFPEYADVNEFTLDW